jgi:hypothetical protein
MDGLPRWDLFGGSGWLLFSGVPAAAKKIWRGLVCAVKAVSAGGARLPRPAVFRWDGIPARWAGPNI